VALNLPRSLATVAAGRSDGEQGTEASPGLLPWPVEGTPEGAGRRALGTRSGVVSYPIWARGSLLPKCSKLHLRQKQFSILPPAGGFVDLPGYFPRPNSGKQNVRLEPSRHGRRLPSAQGYAHGETSMWASLSLMPCFVNIHSLCGQRGEVERTLSNPLPGGGFSPPAQTIGLRIHAPRQTRTAPCPIRLSRRLHAIELLRHYLVRGPAVSCSPDSQTTGGA
jgi:hypothetical protein